MKIKYFLRGFGAGVLITTLVLCMSYRSQDSQQSVVQKAKELGMVFPQKTPSASPLVSSPSPLFTAKPSVTPSAVATGTAVTVTQNPYPKSKKEAKKSSKTFTVRDGLLSSSVARELKEVGIIKDDAAFDKYLEKSGMGRKIRAGKYKIPTGASYEQIARIITRQD